MNELAKQGGLRLLMLVLDPGAAKEAEKLLETACVKLRFRIRAEGTVSNELLDYLGLGGRDKVILMITLPRALVPHLLMKLRMELQMDKPGHGIAFAFPISSVSNPLARLMDTQVLAGAKQRIELEVHSMEEQSEYRLIVAVVNEGQSDTVMDAAKKAGARGGTLVRARRLGMEEAVRFWGISLQNEREIVMILVPKENKNEIMKAIGAHVSMKQENAGFLFALPVDNVIGLA